MPDNSPLTKADFEDTVNAFEQRLKDYIDERTHDIETSSFDSLAMISMLKPRACGT